MPIDIVQRTIRRYSMVGEMVLDPFAGLGTVPSVAVTMGRQGLGIELNERYWADGVGYCRAAEGKLSSPTLFDTLAAEDAAA